MKGKHITLKNTFKYIHNKKQANTRGGGTECLLGICPLRVACDVSVELFDAFSSVISIRSTAVLSLANRLSFGELATVNK